MRYRRDGAVGVISLDRPPVNAYDAAMHRQLTRAWQVAAGDDQARVIVLRAEGRNFCAGADLGSPTGLDAEPEHDEVTPWDELGFIRNLPKPTIAAVQGGCIGGAQRFVFPCDLLFCSENAFFRDPLVSMGIGGIQAPIHAWLYGPRLAKEMLYSGMAVSAQRLYTMGTVNRIYPRQALTDETLAFARSIARQDPPALRQAKRAVNMTSDIMGQHYIANRFMELMDPRPQPTRPPTPA